MDYNTNGYAKQLIRFEGLDSGECHPSDIDAVVDLHGNGWLVFEAKYYLGNVPVGQKIMLERLTAALSKTRPTLTVVCEHRTRAPRDVVLADCIVRFYTTDGVSWKTPTHTIRVKELVSRFWEREESKETMDVTGTTTIFRKDWDDGGVSYSRGISSKDYVDGHQTDKYITSYERVQLPIGTNLENMTKINVTDGFEAVYKTKSGKVQRKLVVRAFEIIKKPGGSAKASQQAESWMGFEEIQDNDIPF